MAQRGGTAHTTNPTMTDPRFGTWKFQDSFDNPRGSLNSFNMDAYGRRANPGRVSAPDFGFAFDPTGSGYVTDKGTTIKPHVDTRVTPRPVGTTITRRPEPRLKDDNVLAFAPAPIVAKRPNRAVSAINEMALPNPKKVVARRQPNRGISLATSPGRAGGGNAGIAQNPYYRNTPGSQTFGIYPQTGSQQNFSLHNPNSYQYSPTNY